MRKTAFGTNREARDGLFGNVKQGKQGFQPASQEHNSLVIKVLGQLLMVVDATRTTTDPPSFRRQITAA